MVKAGGGSSKKEKRVELLGPTAKNKGPNSSSRRRCIGNCF